DLAVFVPDLNIINARLFIHPFFAIAALVLAARRYLRAAIVVLAAYILAALAIGWSLDLALGPSLLAQQVIFGPLAVTAIVLAILDKLLWLGAVFVALPSALGHDSPDSLHNRGHDLRGGPLTGPYLGAVSPTVGRPHYHGITCKPLSPPRTWIAQRAPC